MPEGLQKSQTMGAKLHSQKGNSPDYHLRSLNFSDRRPRPTFDTEILKRLFNDLNKQRDKNVSLIQYQKRGGGAKCN